jgi:pimeloyl-ACP methyl ester carboxylesterase
MWGPSEFYVTGVLKSWDVTPLLGRIRAPTLITSGRYDEATASVMKPAHQGIAGSKHIVFEQSSHMSHVEEAERYIPEVIKFLDGVESKRRS